MTIPRLFSIALVVLAYLISFNYKYKDVFDLSQHRNSIIEYFGEFNIEKFSEIKSKNANKAFYVHYGYLWFQQYVYRDIMAPYRHQSELMYPIDRVRKDVNNLSLFSNIKLKTAGYSGVWLSDINGNEIVPEKKCYLKMCKEEGFDEEVEKHDVLYCYEKILKLLQAQKTWKLLVK